MSGSSHFAECTCRSCGGPFTVFRHHAARRKYCSHACAVEARRGKTYTARKCGHCGTDFQSLASDVKRGHGKFCSRACATSSLPQTLPGREDHWAWKGNEAGASTKRARAQRWFSLGACEQCSEPAVDRHHKDGDTGNNTPTNVASLCRRCHMAEDGRLAAFLAAGARGRAVKPIRLCAHCSYPAKPCRNGLCGQCYSYRRRNGTDRPAKLFGRKNDGRRRYKARTQINGRTFCLGSYETPEQAAEAVRNCRASYPCSYRASRAPVDEEQVRG